MLLSWVPPRNTPEPEPSVDESAAAVPEASTTETCVVPVSGPAPDAPYASWIARASSYGDGRPAVSSDSRISTTIRPPRDGAGAASTRCPVTSVSTGVRSDDLVRGEVVPKLGEQLGDRRRPQVANALERLAELVGHDPCRIAEDAPPTLLPQEDLREDPVQERARLVAGDALAGELERRLDEVGPRLGREAPVRDLQSRQQTGHGDGAVADVERLRAGVLEVDEHLVHLAQALRRRREEAVEQRRLVPFGVDEQQTPAGRPGQRPLRHERGERRPRARRPPHFRPRAAPALRPPRSTDARQRSHPASREVTHATPRTARRRSRRLQGRFYAARASGN